MKKRLSYQLLSLFTPPSVPRTVQFNDKLPYTEIEGYRFHTETFGNPKNPPIIIVHGGPGGDYEYLKSLQGLSENHFIVFYDQRGTGLSPRVENKELTLERNLNDLKLIVKHYAGERSAKLIGHSWGAMLVASYLSTYPQDISQAVMVEPGMLNLESAQDFVMKTKNSQSISDLFALIKYGFLALLAREEDGHEKFDYMMTSLLNRTKQSDPYQCAGQVMPKNSFKRGGYQAFKNMLKPIMDDATTFGYDLTDGITHYQGDLMLISSECSFIGYKFQERFHIPKLPKQTIHLKAENMGHNMLTLNPKWSLRVLKTYLNNRQTSQSISDLDRK